jgi:8-oxo-dGTP diphosphatase
MIEVAVGILRHNGRVLICRRRRGIRYELKWEFPGGKVGDGETPEASLKRELLEELDIDAEIGEEIFRQRWVYSDHGEFDIHFFSVPTFSGMLKNLAFEDVRWVFPDELPTFDLLEGSKTLAQKLSRHDS